MGYNFTFFVSTLVVVLEKEASSDHSSEKKLLGALNLRI